MMKFSPVFLIFLLVVGCSSKKITEFTDISVSGTGYQGQEAKKLCGQFKLDQDLAQLYFEKAVAIDSNKARSEIDYYSCWVHGELKYQGKSCAWSIDIGGLAVINCAGKEYSRFCGNCESFMLDQIP